MVGNVFLALVYRNALENGWKPPKLYIFCDPLVFGCALVHAANECVSNNYPLPFFQHQ